MKYDLKYHQIYSYIGVNDVQIQVLHYIRMLNNGRVVANLNFI